MERDEFLSLIVPWLAVDGQRLIWGWRLEPI